MWHKMRNSVQCVSWGVIVNLMEAHECVVLLKHSVTLCSVDDCVWHFLIKRTNCQSIPRCSPSSWDMAIWFLSYKCQVSYWILLVSILSIYYSACVVSYSSDVYVFRQYVQHFYTWNLFLKFSCSCCHDPTSLVIIRKTDWLDT